MSKEHKITESALAALLDTSSKNFTVFLDNTMEHFEQYFKETTKDFPSTQKAIALESAFAIKRSSGAHYLALKQSWENLILHCDTSVDHCPSSREIVLQQVLQHFWSCHSNPSTSAINKTCFPYSNTHQDTHDYNFDPDSI